MIRILTKQKKFISYGYSKKDKNLQKKQDNIPQTKSFFDPSLNQLKEQIIREKSFITIYDLLENQINIEEIVKTKEKSFPQQDHWNPKSKNYIHAEIDEYETSLDVDKYNDIIRNFKRDLKIQKEVLDYMQNMKRPHLQGQKGNQQNVFDEVKDYRDIKTEKTNLEKASDFLQTLENHKFDVNNSYFLYDLPPLSNEIEHQQQLENRKVTDHFHHEKGSKFDVEIPYDERFPHVADRLGHPEQILKPYQQILRIDHNLCHPTFLDQPFIQIPKPEPNQDVDFTSGKVLYQNQNSYEISAFSQYTTLLWGLMYFVTFTNCKFFQSTTQLSDSYELIEIIPTDLEYSTIDSTGFFSITNQVLVLTILLSAYKSLNSFFKCFSSKIQFNKDQDLIFVNQIDFWGKEVTKVYEVDHLCLVLPFLKTQSKYLDFSKNGFTVLECMNTKDKFILSNDPKNWSSNEEYMSFMKRVGRDWDKDFAETGFFNVQLIIQIIKSYKPLDYAKWNQFYVQFYDCIQNTEKQLVKDLNKQYFCKCVVK